MAKKQSRRSVSLSRLTYERLRAYCESNGVSMSQFVEGRIGDFLGEKPASPIAVAPPIKKPEVVIPQPPVMPAPAPMAAAPAPTPVVAAPVPAPVKRLEPVAAAPVAAAPVAAPVRVAIPSAPNPGQRITTAPLPPPEKKPVDEAAARRAAERIFTF